LQSIYSQGRPNLGENTWFGAENNEIFAWGPKIENLAFDGSNYNYDQNGMLVPKDGINTNSAKTYNPYDIFQKGFLLKNTVNLRFKRKANFTSFSYTNRQENGFFNATTLSSNLLKFSHENRIENHSWKIGVDYNSSENTFVNTNALWTKTFEAILLTPASFDNSAGYILADGSQRSSAPDFKNNPYNLLSAEGNKFENTYFNAHLDYKWNQDWFNLNFSSKFEKNASIKQFFMPKNAINFINSYKQNEEINSNDIYLHLNTYTDEFEGFSFGTAGILNSEKLDFLRKVNDYEDLSVEKQRNALNWSQTLTYSPNYIDGLYFNLKNSAYLVSNQQKWFLPSVGLSFNIAELFYSRKVDYLKIYTNYSSSIIEMPLYLHDKSYTSINSKLSELNSILENSELFYNKNLDFESRKSFNVGLDAYFFSHRLTFELNYDNTVSANSIFPVLNGNAFELKNIASIRNQNYEFVMNFKNGYYSKIHWKTKILFSMQKSLVKELNTAEKQIPIAGFQSVSKNLIEGEAVGVIVGSAYKRNENNQIVIGAGGFPLVASEKQIIGNPNPDFYLALENSLSYRRRLNFTILLDFQKGGDIWNGTANALNYYGLSETSANERTITDYIFDGVTESGQINTIPVDFANPANSLEGNYWYKYGLGGVAEDAIEDGTFFRVKEVSIAYKPINNNSHFVRELNLKIYARNLLTIKNYSGSSPNSYFNNYLQAKGLDYFNIPETREIGLGVSVKF